MATMISMMARIWIPGNGGLHLTDHSMGVRKDQFQPMRLSMATTLNTMAMRVMVFTQAHQQMWRIAIIPTNHNSNILHVNLLILLLDLGIVRLCHNFNPSSSVHLISDQVKLQILEILHQDRKCHPNRILYQIPL